MSGAYLSVAPGMEERVAGAFKRYPHIAGSTARDATLRMFREQTSESINFVMGLIIFSATVIAAGVVYNSARIAVSERGRELGSLRVLGFTRGEILAMLLGEQGLVTLAALPLGVLLGVGFSAVLATGFHTAQYHFPFIITGGTFVFAIAVVVATTALAGFVVRRLVNRMDIVSVLKTRE
jgi:putative ABC transport system permease protein